MIAPKKEKCQVCKKLVLRTESKASLCNKCEANPFRIEDLRRILATRKNYASFKSTYEKGFIELKNLNNQKFWDNKFKSESLLESQDEMTKDKISIVASLLPLKNKIKMLDLGCGKGYLEEFLQESMGEEFKNIELYCLDISKQSIDELKKKYYGNFTVSDIDFIDKIYKKNYFDAIVALEVLEHIPPSKILSILGKINTILKRSGTFIATIPTNEHLEKKRDNPSSHLRDYSVEIIKAELLISGFEVKKTKLLTAFKQHYKFKTILNKFINRWEPNNIIISTTK